MRAAAGVGIVGDEHVARHDLAQRVAFEDRVTAPTIEPRCIGTRCASAITWPCASKMAVEQSARSLMLGENAVRISVAPISSEARADSAP
jgi:hypothetical protein